MVSSEIDKVINEKCAKEINECIESKAEIPKETVENFIISLKSMLKSNTPIGLECGALEQTLYAFYTYGIDSMPEKTQYAFCVGAIHGCIKMLED